LTFLRFFALFVGASESATAERLSLEGELLLGALAGATSLPDAVFLEAVISSGRAPLDFGTLSVIKGGGPGPVAFLGMPQINTFYDALVAPMEAIALAAVGHLRGSTARPARVIMCGGDGVSEARASVNVHGRVCGQLAGSREETGAAPRWGKWLRTSALLTADTP
jgi:hypothetical protein